MKFAFVLLCLVSFANSQNSCSTCYPGTSSSICPHKKATDPVICGSDGRRHTPCTFNCAKACNPNLRLVGCGDYCVPTSWSRCPDTATTIMPPTGPPVLCLPVTDPKCAAIPMTPADSSCVQPSTTLMGQQCLECTVDSLAKGSCTVSTATCKVNTVYPCNVVFIPPTGACEVDPKPEACYLCLPTSPAKGECVPFWTN